MKMKGGSSGAASSYGVMGRDAKQPAGKGNANVKQTTLPKGGAQAISAKGKK